MIDQLIKPPLMTIFGLAPNMAGSQRTRSAIFPGVIEPSTCEMPWVIAGLMVIFATSRSTRKLPLFGESDGTLGFRLWQTMIMSNNSAMVLTPYGSVGFVELGSTLSSPATLMMSGA